jgi:hypothetical protein
MRARRRTMGNERGMVLFVSLTTLSLLLVAGVAVIVSMHNDFKVTSNLRGSTETFYVAEAGIAWGKEQLSRVANNPPAPANGSQSFSLGTFSVSFLSPRKVSPLVGRVTVQSVGLRGTSSQVIQTGLTKTYDVADGAVSLKGNGRAGFADNSFLLSGLDHDPANGQILSAATPRPGISVSSAAALGDVLDSLSSQQSANIVGGPAITLSDLLPGGIVTTLGDELCNDSLALKQSIPPGGVLSVVGATWGSQSSLQLRCIDGLDGSGDSVILSGSSIGAGILVVRNADLVVNGGFRWEGLILVSGNSVGFRVTGSEVKEIYGAIVVNENNPTIPNGRLILDLQGSVKVLYSRAALARSAALFPTAVLDGLYGFLPATITQDYWRAVTP